MVRFSILWLFTAIILSAFCTEKNLKAKGCPKEITVQGVIKVTGNDPFTHLILQNKDGNYRVIDDAGSAAIRAEFQNRKIEIKGCLFTSEMEGLIPRLQGDLKVIDFKEVGHKEKSK